MKKIGNNDATTAALETETAKARDRKRNPMKQKQIIEDSFKAAEALLQQYAKEEKCSRGQAVAWLTYKTFMICMRNGTAHQYLDELRRLGSCDLVAALEPIYRAKIETGSSSRKAEPQSVEPSTAEDGWFPGDRGPTPGESTPTP